MNATIATTKSRGPAPSDASLVAAAKSGDPEAFKLLVERHRPIVLFSAMSLTDTHEDAEDAVQQCFQKAFVHLKQFQGRSSFSIWLIRIARNQALMLRRNERRRRNISMGEIEQAREEPTVDGSTRFRPERGRYLFTARAPTNSVIPYERAKAAHPDSAPSLRP